MTERKPRKPRVDIARVASVVLGDVNALVARLVPGGKVIAGNWVGCNPVRGETHPSLSVSLKSGAFFDHADDTVRGGDLVALYAYVHDLKQLDAARELARAYSVMPGEAIQRDVTPAPAQQKEAKPASEWKPIVPAPADAGSYPVAHVIRGRADQIWEYRDRGGALVGVVHRYTTSDGGKELVPFVFAEHPEKGRQWHGLAFPDPRPLYGLQHLSDDKFVLVVEGEKCADVAREQLGTTFDVISWAGGGNATQKSDWTPLRGRRVVIWPDCDAKVDKKTQKLKLEPEQPGVKTAEKIAKVLLELECEVRIVRTPAPGSVKDGWDIADAVDEGWSAERLQSFIQSSLRASWAEAPLQTGALAPPPAPPANGPPSNDEPPPDPDWDRFLIRRRGELVACLSNAIEILRNTPAFAAGVAYDEFAMRVVRTGALPSHARAPAPPAEWTDDDDTRTTIWIQRTWQMIGSSGLVGEAINAIARERPFHPVREYLATLQWDGTPRLDTWLSDYLGVPDNGYTKRVSRWYLMGMCVRALYPGTKFDYCLVLEGRQGLLKSSSLKVLGGAWYSDTELDLHNKDAMSSIRGKWLHEFSEMGSIARAEEMRQKSFLSREVDEFRPTYGRREIRCPRQLVFAGSTNQWQWNKDPTGGRRFWPIEVTSVVDVAGLAAARDQLFAEALVRVRAKERYWPTDEEQRALFDPEQLQREAPEVFVELLEKWFWRDGSFWETHVEFTLADAITIGLNIDAARNTRDIQTRAGNALKRLGCQKIERRNSAVRFVYKRPDRKAVESEAPPSERHERQPGEDDDVPL